MKPIDLTQIRTYSIQARGHKVDSARLAGLPAAGATFADWFASLPPYLGAAALRRAVERMAAARRAGRGVAWAIGAHVVKVGCGPILVDLIERKLITAVAMNGATAIHDYELAVFGATSEEVAETIQDGRFGMVRETAEFFGAAALRGAANEQGLGAAAGSMLIDAAPANLQASVLAAAAKAGIPATVHVAIGTDTIHMHPTVDAAALGAASAIDFRLACAVVAGLGAEKPADSSTDQRSGASADQAGGAGGVWCNVGSAVILPEIFLKAVSVARNLGHDLDALCSVNFDMQSHYRPRQNVIGRPVAAGRGIEVIGQHEILLPLVRQAWIEAQGKTSDPNPA